MTIPLDGRNGATVVLLVLGLLVIALAVVLDKLAAFFGDNSAERARLDAALNPHVQEARRLAGLNPGTGRRRITDGGVSVAETRSALTGEGDPTA